MAFAVWTAALVGWVAWFLAWLLAPLWNRPREAAPIPAAAIAGHARFSARPPRRPMTEGEKYRVLVGLLLIAIAGLTAAFAETATERACGKGPRAAATP